LGAKCKASPRRFCHFKQMDELPSKLFKIICAPRIALD